MVCLWIRTWVHTVPVSCQQNDCERGQSLTTGSSDISTQTNNIFDQNHMMNIIHLIEQTGYHWLSRQYCVCVWLKMYSCTWPVWSASCGFSVDQEIMTNNLHDWFMNNERKMTSLCFIQQRNFVSHPVNRVCVRHKCHKEAQTNHYVLHPFNQQSNDMLCTLITWLLSPVAGCCFARSECTCTLTHP